MTFLAVAFASALMLCAESAPPLPYSTRMYKGVGKSTEEPQISLQVNYESIWYETCGGAVIAENWVLTSSDCAYVMLHYSTKDSQITVDEGVEEKEKVYIIDKIVMHPDFGEFGSGFQANDIALMKTLEPIKDADDYIINLPSEDEEFINANCTVTSWDCSTMWIDNEMGGPTFQETKVHVLKDDECSRLTHSGYYNQTHNMCSYNYGSEPCAVRLGGPMVCKGVLAGVTSYGPRLYQTHQSVYTKVSNYLDWLRSTMSS